MPRNQGNTSEAPPAPQFKKPNMHPKECQTESTKILDANPVPTPKNPKI